MMTVNEVRGKKADVAKMLNDLGIAYDENANRGELAKLYVDFINAQTPEATVSTRFDISPMRQAIIGAARTGNKKPISEDDAVKAGATKEQFDEYKKLINTLKDAVDPYINIQLTNAKAEEKKAIFDSIFPAWKMVMPATTTDKFHKNMWIDESDAVNLVHYDILDMITELPTGATRVRTTQTPTMFRKGVEIYLGLKIAANDVMTKENRDIIMEFQRAEKSLENQSKKLNGYEDNNGNHINGIVDEIVLGEKKMSDYGMILKGLVDEKESLEKMPQEEQKGALFVKFWTKTQDDIERITKEKNLLAEELKKLRKAEKNAKSAKEEAQKTIASLEPKAKEILAQLKLAMDDTQL